MDSLPRFSRSLRASLRLDIQRNTTYQADQVVVNLWHEENERAKYVEIKKFHTQKSVHTFFIILIAERFHGRNSKRWYSKNLSTTRTN